MSELEFAAGLMVKPPRPGAPDYVIGSISIKVDEFVPWLKSKMADKPEWINLDIKQSKNGKWYAAVNTYKKEEAKKPKPADPFDDQIPF